MTDKNNDDDLSYKLVGLFEKEKTTAAEALAAMTEVVAFTIETAFKEKDHGGVMNCFCKEVESIIFSEGKDDEEISKNK